MPKKLLPMVTVPPDHTPAQEVPIGGSMCANCRFYSTRGGRFGSCREPNYAAYYKTNLIPVPPDRFCSDWYKEIPGSLGSQR